MAFGDIIKQTRKQKGLTQVQLAEQSGVTSPTVARIERSDNSASFKKIQKVCECLELKADIVVVKP